MGNRMKTWWLFGYMPWSKGESIGYYGTDDKRWKPIAFGFWYLYSSRCPVTGVWM